MALSNSEKLRCVFCNKSLPSDFYLTRHLQAHSQESPFHCRFCKLELRQKESFIIHLANVHPKEVKVSGKRKGSKNWNQIKSKYEKCCRNTCVFCNKRYVREDVFESHLRSHTGERPYECTKCYRAFTDTKLLRVHYLGLHGKYQTLCTCKLCSKTYNDRSGMRKHFRLQHSGKPLSFRKKRIKRKSNVQNNQRRQLNVGPMECEECGKRLGTKQYLKKHYKLYHPEQQFTLKIVDPVLNTIMQSRHKCVFCGKGFLYRRELNRHLKAKIGERQYFCHRCDLELKDKTHLRDHLFKTHKILPKGIENSRKRSEKPERYCRLSCIFCQKFFTCTGVLEGHIRSHIDERPFLCPYCPKGLKTKATLKHHIQTLHPDGKKSKSTQPTAKNKKSPLVGKVRSDLKSGMASTSQNSKPKEQSLGFNIENCRAGNCRWCNTAVEGLPRRRFTFICPEPDPTGNDPVRCGRQFQCLYQMALHFRDDHRIPIFQNVK